MPLSALGPWIHPKIQAKRTEHNKSKGADISWTCAWTCLDGAAQLALATHGSQVALQDLHLNSLFQQSKGQREATDARASDDDLVEKEEKSV